MKYAYRQKQDFGFSKKGDLFIGPYPTMEVGYAFYHESHIGTMNSMNFYEHTLKAKPDIFEFIGEYKTPTE